MIDKLESAGLGYYVKSAETRQRLGNYKFVVFLFTVCFYA